MALPAGYGPGLRMQLFDAIDKYGSDADTCFLCGARLNDGNRSDEHVVPKWRTFTPSLTIGPARKHRPFKSWLVKCRKMTNVRLQRGIP